MSHGTDIRDGALELARSAQVRLADRLRGEGEYIAAEQALGEAIQNAFLQIVVATRRDLELAMRSIARSELAAFAYGGMVRELLVELQAAAVKLSGRQPAPPLPAGVAGDFGDDDRDTSPYGLKVVNAREVNATRPGRGSR